MNEYEWRVERDSRSMRYAGRVLDPERWIVLRADREYAARYDGQVAILTAANLLGRMSPAIRLDIPEVSIVPQLPSAGTCLPKAILHSMYEADPYGKFVPGQYHEADYVVRLGRNGSQAVTHGSGWNAYCGPSPSPVTDDQSFNPVGPAMAAIMAASEAFRTDLRGVPTKTLLNGLTWTPDMVKGDLVPHPHTDLDIGNLWFVGAGSVGTSLLYFLRLATQALHTTLFDHDVVNIHNLDRSPIFVSTDVNSKKVDATKLWLNENGIDAIAEPRALHKSGIWCSRQQGAPDVLVSAANEYNVRSVIEGGFPPLQIYGTTGSNWQAAMIRHIPLLDPCSRCLFPEDKQELTLCATGSLGMLEERGADIVDAALPFLSFAAGAMAAAEILKVNLPGYPFTVNRVIFNTSPYPRFVFAPIRSREQCVCSQRSSVVHRQMIEGTRYEKLSSQDV